MAKKTVKKPAKTGVKNGANGAKPVNGNGSSNYTAKDIYVLEGLEPVRKRPGMYIGSTGVDGLHHLVWEVVDNSIDEAMAGYARHVRVELLKDNRVAVTDDGRGIPVEVHKQTKKSALETVMTTLHAGGKFGGESYKVSGGLHGVGVSVVCALSAWMRAEVCREGGLYSQEYVRGVPRYKVKREGKCEQNGTKVVFEPDPEVFKEIKFDYKRIVDHLRQQAFLTKGIEIEIIDSREAVPIYHAFCFEGGLLSFLTYLSEGEKPYQETPFYVEKGAENVEVEAAFAYSNAIETRELSFANNIYTPDGGMHLTGFRSALTRSLNSYMRQNEYAKKDDENLTADDVREGLVAIVSVKLREPQFEGQTKARLGNTEARTAVESVVGEALKDFLERNGSDARRIIEKCLLAAKARKAAKAAKDMVLRKGALEGLTLPGKLADCTSRNPAESELFIVEGDSAGGCFSGETEVALADGRNVSFENLVREAEAGKKNFCYTIGNDGRIRIAPVLHPRRTKRAAPVVRVILDSGEEVVCTPDHKFMARDGAYREAQQLMRGNSLMPLYRRFSKIGGSITIEGYEMVFDPRERRWIFTHMRADRYNLEQGVYREAEGPHRHHKDYNKRNNNPDNIIRLTREGHLDIHRAHAERTLKRPDVLEKLRILKKTPEYRSKISKKMLEPAMRALLSERGKRQWHDEAYKHFMTERFAEFYRTHSEYRERNRAILVAAQRTYWNSVENRNQQSKRVREYFAAHPEKRKVLAEQARREWDNEALRNWRREQTKQQWTDGFRTQRKEAYAKTYQRKALDVFRAIYDEKGVVDFDAYEKMRRRTNDKTLFRYQTILTRFFGNSRARLNEAVVNHNHKVIAVVPLRESIDVYDLEVSETHNFALAAGVFVHNSAKGGRDRRTQAILPLRGKILNVEKARIDKMLANKEIKSLVVAIGTAIAETFDLSKLRYHKIVVMTDADVDGAHIRTLLLTLFYRYFRPVVEGGYLYIATPPLYRVAAGKEARYVYSDGEKERAVTELAKSKAPSANRKAQAKGESVAHPQGESEAIGDKRFAISIQRYKGLGEMNPEQLWETTMDPSRRILKQVMIEDAKEADRLFDILMGEEVEPRKQFIQAHALAVKNLDV